MRRGSRLALLALAAWAATLAVAPAALATTYVRNGGQGGGGGGGSLPFTGAELGIFAAAGLVLVAAGVALRLAARRAARTQ